MPATFSAAEKHICGLFSPGSTFTYQGAAYTVECAGKPTCRHGEPKTDVYVKAVSPCGSMVFKISFKKENADFLENKITEERAVQLFGPCWNRIISSATIALQCEFEDRPLIYKESHGKTGAGAITLGWKFEILNVGRGQLSGDMPLSRSKILDVYAGTNLPCDKRNASVNGKMIPDSGVANFILFEERTPRSLQEAVDRLVTIDEYVALHPKVYFACKALNYRTFDSKYDGNRPLAVYVDWSVADGKLVSKLVYSEPLEKGGDYAFKKLETALRKLGVATTADLGCHNVADPGIIWGK